MTEPDTAALVETIQAALGPGGVWTSDSHAALAALDTLAQRLADAERRAEEVLRHIATWQPEGQSDAEIVTLFRDLAAAYFTEEPEHG